MMGCGQCGGNCAGCGPNCPCKSAPGLGNYERTEAAILAYAQNKIAQGRPFYFSPSLNSDVFALNGMGFLPALAAAVVKIAPTVASVAGTAASIKSMKSGGKIDPNSLADAILPEVKAKLAAQGVNLPADAAKSITVAGVLDAFGPQYRPFVIGGLGLVGAVLLMRILRR